MPRRRSSRAGPQREEEVPEGSGPPAGSKGLSEYEIQRLSRIEENRKRMAALGLPKIASSLMESPSRRSARKVDDKGKRKLDDEDKDYEPDPDEAGGVDDDDDDEDEEYSAPGSTRKKGKRRMSTPKRKTPVKKVPIKSDSVDDDDELMQAIALSLRGNNEIASPGKVEDVDPKGRARRTEVRGESRKGKSRSLFSSRVKMTEDEVILHFFQFDEAGKGSINMKDLAKVATAHDFTWTDKELLDMIHCFDADGDGKLGLDDFRKIAERCNMIQGPE
ncbi:nucleolin-like [Punica granatum]|uniref:Nucleolin-like n=1 Tax=Punica granatum TaxID=22663 RepID=A0A218VWF3_PUNGR|nr:nucleolin-like [Punica granatum]OWM64904.1 hypothetical protein CDL15_Pgr028621 [Punica granatum]